MLGLQDTYARPLVTEALRTVVADLRNGILSGDLVHLPEQAEYAEQTLQKIVEKIGARMRPVVNATGTVTHTNLGRSLLSTAACEAIQQAAGKLCQPRIRSRNRQAGTSGSHHRTAPATIDGLRSIDCCE